MKATKKKKSTATKLARSKANSKTKTVAAKTSPKSKAVAGIKPVRSKTVGKSTAKAKVIKAKPKGSAVVSKRTTVKDKLAGTKPNSVPIARPAAKKSDRPAPVKVPKAKSLPEQKPVAAAAPKSKLDTSKKPKLEAKLNSPKATTLVNRKPASEAAKPQAPDSKNKEEAPPPSNTNPTIVAKIRNAQAEKELRKDLAQPAPKTSLTLLTQVPQLAKGKDRLVLMVRDAYWIHAHWDIMRNSVERAKAALAENWHTVKPILRLLKLDDSGTTNNAEVIYKDIEIHGGVRNWYVDVDCPPSRFKMLMGYVGANSRFYELARSNIVTTPAPGSKEATDDHWADVANDAEHIYSMSGGYGDDTQTGDLTEVFEEKLKRTMDADVLSQFGSGAEGSLKRHKQFHFDVNAELVVFGSTHPEAHVSVGSEPVKVRSDGSFSIRLPLPDRRQVLPATAKSRDGVDEQTVVIAVERNTKVMEPLSSDTDDL